MADNVNICGLTLKDATWSEFIFHKTLYKNKAKKKKKKFFH